MGDIADNTGMENDGDFIGFQVSACLSPAAAEDCSTWAISTNSTEVADAPNTSPPVKAIAQSDPTGGVDNTAN